MSEPKRFQSGSEIFETFIPNYRPPESIQTNSFVLEANAEIVANGLLAEFQRRILKGATTVS